MSKRDPNEKFSPLIWIIPVPFVLAAFLPLTIEHPMPAKTERMAATTDSATVDRAASSPRLPHAVE